MQVPKTATTRLVLPRGVADTTEEPANADAGTLSFDPTDDTIRVKTSTGWEDVGSGGGGGGTITSVTEGTGIDVTNPTGPVVTVAVEFGTGAGQVPTNASVAAVQADIDAHEANTSNPHAVTKAQVGLGNVTNDAQLKRSANDWGAFVSVPSPVANDRVLLEGVNVGYGKVITTVNGLAAYIATLTGGSDTSTHPYLAPPAAPNAWDDEFESGSSDLAVRGWQVKSTVGGGTILTRAGDIQLWSATGFATAPAAGTYRSSLIGSYMFIQTPAAVGGEVYIGKALTAGTSGTVYGRVQGYNLGKVATADQDNVSVFVSDGSGYPVGNRVNHGVSQNPTSQTIVRLMGGIVGGTYNTILFQTLSPALANEIDVMGVRYCGTRTYYDVGVTTGGHVSTMSPSAGVSPTTVPLVSTLNGAGVGIYKNTAIDTFNLLAIDFLRFIPGDGWIAKAPRVRSGGLGSRSSNIYWEPPATANAFDDEFNIDVSTEADLAVRGWNVTHPTTGATMTRVGDVLPWASPTGLSATQYRSTMTRDGLFVQCTVEMQIWKPATGSFQLRAHIYGSAGSNANHWNGAQLASINPPTQTASLRRFRTITFNNNIVIDRIETGSSQFTIATRGQYTEGAQDGIEYLIDWDDSAKSAWGLIVRRHGYHLLRNPYAWAAFSPAAAGVAVITNTNSAGIWTCIKYIRKTAQGSYPGM